MREESQRWIQIKDDDEQPECNNELFYLRSQRFCQRNSRECRQCCSICETHGDERLKNQHIRIKMDEFNSYFQRLEATCNKETEHYIRQMNEAEENAVKMIAKKKQEYLQQIEEVKAHMMKKTYRTLEEKYTQLYQKYKNQRLDTLKCCEVFWVMNAQPSNHLLKHSQINKKLESILKKFEAFKQVSKNLPTENIFNDKSKGKKTKLSEKLQAMAEVPRQSPVIIQKSNYGMQQERKYRAKIEELNQQVKNLIKRKQQQQKKLKQIENDIYFHLKKGQMIKSKLKIQIKTINVKIENKLNNRNQNEVQPKILSFEGKTLTQNMISNSLSIPVEANPKINNQPIIEEVRIQTNAIIQELPIQKQNLPKNGNEQQKQDGFGVRDQVQQDKIIIKESNNIRQLLNSTIPQQKPLQAEVKLEANDHEPFVQWTNTELVDQIKKYGNKVQTGLKVEEIDRLKSFSYVKLSQNIGKLSSSLLNKKQSLVHKDKNSTPQKKKPNDFVLMAEKLFQKLSQSKKSNQKQPKVD